MTMFYQDVITQKSWTLLTQLKKKVDFILIGGWAVYLYTKGLKSKDIDIIIDFPQLEYFKKNSTVLKNQRLKKYEVKKDGVDIDIYLPYFSLLGLPAEEIMKYKEKKETFTLAKKELLIITKQSAYAARKTSIKGQKDKIDILSLILLADFDFAFYLNILKKYKLMDYSNELIKLISETSEVPELSLNKHFFAKKKKEIKSKLYSPALP